MSGWILKRGGREVPIPEIFNISLPRDVSVSQLSKVFAKYASDHPERLHEYYLRVLLDSWRNIFPYAPATGKRRDRSFAGGRDNLGWRREEWQTLISSNRR
jgi:hypothetical protein